MQVGMVEILSMKGFFTKLPFKFALEITIENTLIIYKFRDVYIEC